MQEGFASAESETKPNATNNADTLANAFSKAGDMEVPLRTARDLVMAIARVAETLGGEDEGGIVQTLAWLAKDQCDVVEEMRGDLFHLTHPNREQFEKAGWPDDKLRADAA